MHVGLITVAHGRHGHLRRQHEGLAAVDDPPATRVVVAVDDPGIAAIAGDALVVTVGCDSPGLPIAHARTR